ncbi:MAG: prepilin-type N-terminal cleavage/methylation protein, partial [Phycisphaerales bacterium]|nr:prepilin-type N-terminal cleavage/methylation protein [Phycisphaerales bacterium]
GILAAIALPTFLGQSNKAKDSSAKSDVRNAVTQMESCLADGSKNATTCAADPSVLQFKLLTKPVTVDAGGDGYTLEAKSETDNLFRITKSTGAPGSYTRECTTVKTGAGCSAAAGATSAW